MLPPTKPRQQSYQALRRLIQREPSKRPGEVCELCAVPVEKAHSHVVDLETRSLLCACRSCYLLFNFNVPTPGKYRAVPERYLYDPTFTLSEAQWESFQIPVRMAFLFRNSVADRVAAFYPSPAGAIESTLPLEAWEDLSLAVPTLTAMQPDVESLLVYGGRGETFECYLVPIDACYELAGIVRTYWRGFDGGERVWTKITDFFTTVRDRSRPVQVAST